jgi:hypothetical protein
MLEDFDDDFTTATATSSSQSFDLAKLPDGDYEFAVQQFEVKETKAGPLVSLKLAIITEGPFVGKVVQRDYWLTKLGDNGTRVKNDQQIAQVRDDLKKLGFDTGEWTKENGRPFSREINRVGACIKDVCFKGRKKANVSGGKTYQNLYVNDRLTTDGKPAAFGPKEMDDANADPFG